MIIKWIFDRFVSLIGLVCLSWLYLIVAILIKLKMPGGPVFFIQKRVGRYGKMVKVHKFRTMTIQNKHEKFTGIAATEKKRITPLGAKLRRYKIDELPELWDVFIGNMSFVGPRPDIPGYADQLKGDNLEVLSLRPGITGPASLKYRNEEEILSLMDNPQKYNDEVIYPDKVRLNRYYLHNYSFLIDVKMIICTVLNKKMNYAGEEI